MATKLPARSILKQQDSTTKPTVFDQQKAQAEKDRRNLGIALHHANRIQNQKDIQAQILANIEVLLDYPAGSSFTHSEASKFTALVKPFQPSDFDSLVEERCVDGKCGHALCSKAPRSATLGANAVWKLKAQGASDYCSDYCVRKALYVKTQLSEVPAWERQPGEQPDIVLHEDDRPSPTTASRARTKEWVRQQATDQHELALERGEQASSFRPGQVMTSNVVEKASTTHQPRAFTKTSVTSHTAIEGYEPFQGQNEATPAFPLLAHDESSAQIGETAQHGAANDEDESWRDLFTNVEPR